MSTKSWVVETPNSVSLSLSWKTTCLQRLYLSLWGRCIQVTIYSVGNLLKWNLTHWGRVTYTCVSKLTIIGSDNGLSPGRRQTIIWTNAGILLIRTSGTNLSEILGEIHSFSFSKMRLKMSSAKWRLFDLGLNEFKNHHMTRYHAENNELSAL